MIRWFARNTIAANFVMFGILLFGIWTAIEKIPLEVQPSIEFREVRVNVEYRGGSPEDVERGVVIPIERSLEGLPGVKEIYSRVSAGNGEVRVIAQDGVDTREMLDETPARGGRRLPPFHPACGFRRFSGGCAAFPAGDRPAGR